MSFSCERAGRRALVALAGLCVAGALWSAAPARAGAADGFTCRASAIRVQGLGWLLGVNAEPAVANSAGAPCAGDATQIAATPPALAPLAQVSLATAATTASDSSGSASTSLTGPTVLPASLDLTASAATASAGYTCTAGQPVPSGSSNVVGLRIGGGPPITTSGPVTLPGGALADVALNETIGTPASITRRAVDITILSGPYRGAEIVLGEATAGTYGSPCAAGAGQGSGGSGGVTPPGFTQTPQTVSDTGTAEFTYGTGASNAQLQCSLDGAPFKACSGHTSFHGLSIGRHTFAVRAVVNGTPGPVTLYTWYVVRGCPPAGGSLHGTTLGLVRLGMTRRQARNAYRYSTDRGKRYEDFFCVTPQGVRVGYASPRLLKTLKRSQARRLKNHVVLALTANRRYSIGGVRPGASLAAARRRLGRGYLFHVGLNRWYLVRHGNVTAVLKVRRGRVEEVGIAMAAVTRGRAGQRAFITSFS